MDDTTLENAVSLALNPCTGTPFEFGGRAFTLQFLTCDGEERLVNLLTPRIKALALAGDASHQQVMNAIFDLMPEAVAIILGDYDPTIDLAWVKAVRQKSVSLTMYEIIAAQFEVNDLGKLLAGRWQIDAVLSAADQAQTSSTPAT